jgi:peroxiredoxin Q/BCP
MVEIGKSVPDFKLPSTTGQDFKLKEYRGKKIVLYFYPKDATPGCTLEGLDFSRLHKKFQKKNTEVFGVSKDSFDSHCKFKSKQKFSFELLSDEDGKACEIFDVIKMKNMYGKKFLGIERSTFVIDEKGKLMAEWRKVKVDGHAEEVLASL